MKKLEAIKANEGENIDPDNHGWMAPGMNTTAKIQTGQRRVMEYLLSPIQRASSESLREQ